MNTRQRRFLVNMNQVLIFALTAGGLLMDGLQLADLTCMVALLVWLWLPLCARLEARLLCWTSGRRGAVRLPGGSPFV